MTLPSALQDREYQKFEDVEPGKTAVRVTGTSFSGSFTPSGLFNEGKITEVSIDSTTWTALPATALVDRNHIGIQNQSGVDIKLNYDNTVVGYVGVLLANGNERHYDIQDNIIIYAKSASGTVTIVVEELS